jgi:hypothetical protein
MSNELNVEELLRRTPQPEPPADLLPCLERQMHLPKPETRPIRQGLWHRLWLPATSFAGAVAAVVVALSLWNAGTTRTLAASLSELVKLKSFRVIERVRSGPGKPVIKDKSKRPQDWPNYLTSPHPSNPVVENQYWFKYDPRVPSQGLTRTSTPEVDIWRAGNVILTVARSTGEREVMLDSSQTMFAGIANSLLANRDTAFRQVPAREAPDLPATLAGSVWVGEAKSKFNGSEHICRVWINRANDLPLRMQWWGTEWPEIAPRVLLQEWEFTDFDADFPADTFAFEVTDADLAPLGITRSDLEKLPATAFSVRLDGVNGAEVAGTVKDQAGVREVKGKLPFAFVHSPAGDAELDFRMVDGKQRNFGISVNGTAMNTIASRIVGTVPKGGNASVSSAD